MRVLYSATKIGRAEQQRYPPKKLHYDLLVHPALSNSNVVDSCLTNSHKPHPLTSSTSIYGPKSIKVLNATDALRPMNVSYNGYLVAKK